MAKQSDKTSQPPDAQQLLQQQGEEGCHGAADK